MQKQSDNMTILGTDDYEKVQSIYEDFTYGVKPMNVRSKYVRNRLTYEYEPEVEFEEGIEDEIDCSDEDFYNLERVDIDVEELDNYDNEE